MLIQSRSRSHGSFVSGGATPYISHDFEDGTKGAFGDPWGAVGARITFPADPTPRATGKVASIHYSVTGTSDDLALNYARNVGYGETLWFKGDLHIPLPPLIARTKNRKILDFQGTGNRVTYHVVGNDLYVSVVYNNDGSELDPSTGYTLAFDTWHRFDVRVTTNSGNGVADGSIALYTNGGGAATHTLTGIDWSRTGGATPLFTGCLIGSQVTMGPGESTDEVRYWDNVAFGPGRMT